MSMCDNKFLAREQQICAWEPYEGFLHFRCLYLTTFRTMLSCSPSLLVIRGPFQHELDLPNNIESMCQTFAKEIAMSKKCAKINDVNPKVLHKTLNILE